MARRRRHDKKLDGQRKPRASSPGSASAPPRSRGTGCAGCTRTGSTDKQIRSQLARFLFKGDRAEQQAGTLSGGERFRAALAATMLAAPAPQLLLDEPTNNLDLVGVLQLTSALESYEGALVIAGHDLPFLESVGITRWILLDDELRETDAEEVRELFNSSDPAPA
ncbi:ATP-binding cassette domain-containing protein [Streptomyces sp. ISL-63]|uniref:ATP-binding cassette domain-containing protein n=1 Tax=unclassified Streptomyces TaxID=2593676 RepID=UPI0035AB6D8D